jgi:hypothetical protein
MAVLAEDLVLVVASNQLGGSPTSDPANDQDALFGPITSTQTTTGGTEYSCVYIINTSSEVAYDVGLTLSSTSNLGVIDITIGNGSSPVNSSEPVISNGSPSSVSFGNLVNVGDLQPGDFKSIWFKMDVPPNTPVSIPTFSLTISADTEL